MSDPFRPAFFAAVAVALSVLFAPRIEAQDPAPPDEPTGARAPQGPGYPVETIEPEPDSETEADTETDDPYPWTPPAAEPLPVEGAGVLQSVVGAGRLVTLPEPVARVALADEEVARVQMISPREVLLTGLRPGKTTLFVWLADGRRLRYLFQAELDLHLLRRALHELDPRIEASSSPDGTVVVLQGEVQDAKVAARAKGRAEALLAASEARGVRVVDHLRHPDPDFSPDDRLAAALAAVDPRIRARRVQVGPERDPLKDTYVLEGRVKNAAALVRALTLAERQLGGTGIGVVPVEGRSPWHGARRRGFRGNFRDRDPADAAGARRLDYGEDSASGLVAEISRGLVMTTPSGRVISFLEVDEISQILVSIRVMEVDRGKARRMGVNFRFDSEHVSLGSYTGPQGRLPGLLGDAPTVTPITGGNLAVAFVDHVAAIAAAVDFLEDQQVARSVAEPNILTLSGERASIHVGGEVPIPTTTVGDVAAVQGFFFQEFGVRLNLRPTLDDQGVITLEVSPSIIRPEVALSVSNVPGFSVQSVRTTARLRTGQSLVIGGLLDFEESLEERALPFLGKIPLFRWRRRSRAETELVFIISPRLVEIDPAVEHPPEAVPPVDPERLRLPALPWPDDRDGWRERFDPRPLGDEGIPEDFLRPRRDEASPRDSDSTDFDGS